MQGTVLLTGNHPPRIARAALVASLLLGAGTTAAAAPPDLVVRNATVLTMDGTRPSASAFTVTGARFTFVGDDDGAAVRIGAQTRVIDLQGAAVLPGIVDAHLHPVPSYPAGHRLHQVRVSSDTTKTTEDLVRRLRAQADARPAGDWVLGIGYEDTVLGGHPDRHVLDRVSTTHPVYVTHSSGHRAAANTKALELAGITAATPDPPGGTIVKRAGVPTGLLLETAMQPVRAAQDATPDRAELLTGVETTLRTFAAAGITTVVDATPYRRAWNYPVYRALADAARLPVRVIAMLPEEMLDEFDPANLVQDEWVSLGPVKVFHGNSLSGRTAWLSQPYVGRPNDFGIPPARSQAELDALVANIHARGMQAAIHSNGDREIDMVLNAFERLPRAAVRESRHRIEHASVMNASLLERTARLGVVLALHSYVYEHGDKMEDYGAERWDWMHVNRGAIDAGVAVAGNSDYPISAAQPMLRLQSLTTRRARNGKVYGGTQRISVTDALRTFTRGAAHSVFRENDVGSIAAGKLADFVVLSADPRLVAPEALSGVRVTSTWVGGMRVSPAP